MISIRRPAHSMLYMLVILTTATGIASADIISGSSGTFAFNGNAALNTNTNVLSLGSTFTAGTLETANLIIPPSTAAADLSFNFTGSVLNLTLALDGAANTLASSLDWIFSGLDFGGDTITSITQTSGAAAATSFTNGATNAITIITPDESGPLGATYNYSFNIADSSMAAVPEPSSFAMLLAGGIGAYFVRRRRQSAGV